MTSSNGLPAIEKLIGRQNYNTWQFAVQTYLEHEELWAAVLGEEADAKKVTKAKSKIILLIDPINYVHVRSCTTAKDVWKKLQAAFEDSGLTRRVGLLRTLCTTKLENFSSVEEYVNTIMTTAHRLNAIDFTVTDEWIGTFLLSGLPDEYRPMIMGIESSGTKITGDSIKAKLLQDVKVSSGGESNAFLSSKYGNHRRAKSVGSSKHHKQESNSSSSSSRIRCYNCNQYGHKSAECAESKKNKSQSTSVKSTKTNPNQNKGFCAGFSSGNLDDRGWFIDSAASLHMTMRDDWMTDKYQHEIEEITVANNSKLNVKSAGKVVMNLNVENDHRVVPVNDVLHVPELTANLLSVSQIVSKGFTVVFDNVGCKIFDSDGKLSGTGTHINNMFKLDVVEDVQCFHVNNRSESQMNLWHRRMGHINYGDLIKLRDGMAIGVNFTGSKGKQQPCVSCLHGKQTRKPFTNKGTRAKEILELLHSDLCGPMEVNSFSGAKYFYTFIDDYTRKTFIYFLKTKDLAKEVFKDFKALVENQTGKRIKILRSDGGGEYINKDYDDYLKKCGIRHQSTNPHTPQQNGVAERMNRTVEERVRCMISDAGLTKGYWAEAAATAVYVINRSPTSALSDVTPEEAWSNKKPDLSHLRVFGSKAMVHIPKANRKKLDLKSRELIFVGYSEETKGYRFLHPTTKQLIKSRDVVFLEDQFIGNSANESESNKFVTEKVVVSFDPIASDVENTSQSRIGAQNIDEVEIINDDGNQETPLNDSGDISFSSAISELEEEANIVIPRRSERPHKQRVFSHCVGHFVSGCEPEDPKTVAEAMSGKDSDLWRKAMDEEFESLQENNTWVLCDLPPNRKALGCKWVFKSKRDSNGNVVRHKARLVIQGFLQRKGIDYNETYSPVIRYNSIRLLLALAARFDLELEQMDAVTAFIQGDVSEEIYMAQPKEYQQGNKVCKLNKALYGLKQASRLWNTKLDIALKEIGFQRSKVDPCIYFNVNGHLMTFVGIYVDDSITASNDIETKRRLKDGLHKRFKMKDLGELKSCVGLRITRNRDKGEIYVDQERHIIDLLNKFNMADCNPVSTPSDPNQKLTKDMGPKTTEDREKMCEVPYQELVGGLLYIAQGSRPDIAWSVSNVSKFNNNPGKPHWAAAKRILRYLKGTSDAKLRFSKQENPDLIGFSDSDWASDHEDRRSCTGYSFLMQGGPVSWNSKRQPTIALSTTEAEYMALSSAVQEALWLRQFFDEFNAETVNKGIKINCDNSSALDLASKTGYHARTKHIDIRHHFIRQHIEDGRIIVGHVGTNDMVADILTKPLSAAKHLACCKGLGMIF